jgi:hypothetical protein
MYDKNLNLVKMLLFLNRQILAINDGNKEQL